MRRRVLAPTARRHAREVRTLTVDIPDPVRRKATLLGVPEWIDEVPALLEHVADKWQLRLGVVFPDSTEALVIGARRPDDTPVVVKIGVPRTPPSIEQEATVLRLAEGRGCARLLDTDAESHALLLERLGPALADLHVPIRRRHEILCDTAAELWRPIPQGTLPNGADQGRRLMDFILGNWELLDRPCSERAVGHAVACAERRISAHNDERAVLVHGDVHQWNTLQNGTGFSLIDPDGLHAEPECDLGVIMREDPLPLLEGDPHERSRFLAARTRLDENAIWEWGVVERVATGLTCLSVGLVSVGSEMLAVADRVAP